MIGSDHYINILNQELEMIIYSEGGITLSDADNMSADEFPYVLSTLKKINSDKQKAKQDTLKGIMEFASKHIDILYKILANRK